MDVEVVRGPLTGVRGKLLRKDRVTRSEIEALRKVRDEVKVPARVIDKILDDNARALYGL